MTAVTFFRPVSARSDNGLLALIAFARPLLLLAALAFFAGFGGYLILGPPDVLSSGHPGVAVPASATASAPATDIPASDDGAMPDWNLPKHV
jgi:hypothetical protein